MPSRESMKKPSSAATSLPTSARSYAANIASSSAWVCGSSTTMRILPGFPRPLPVKNGEKRRGSRDLSDRRADGPLALQRARDAQHEILAPGRPDDLHADRQRHAL